MDDAPPTATPLARGPSIGHIDEAADLSTRLVRLERSAHVRNLTGVRIMLSVARHAADPAAALTDDMGAFDEGAVAIDADGDVAVDECVARALGVRMPLPPSPPPTSSLRHAACCKLSTWVHGCVPCKHVVACVCCCLCAVRACTQA